MRQIIIGLIGMKGITPKMLFMVFALVLVTVAIIFFVSVTVEATQPACWKLTTHELAKLSGMKESDFFVQNLLGARSEFELRLPAENDCVNRVLFTTAKECKLECDTFAGDKKKCRESCKRCDGKPGCIVAIPVVKQLYNVISRDPAKNAMQIKLTVAVYGADYSFGGDTELGSIKEKKKVYCLGFSRAGGTYYIEKEIIDSEQACGEENAKGVK